MANSSPRGAWRARPPRTRAALEELRRAGAGGEPYDLAILDMQMPVMDGMELAHRLKADPLLRGTRLVMLTSIGRQGDGEEARRAGIEAYVTKPVKQSELYDCLATLMGSPPEAQEEAEGLVTRHSLRERKALGRARGLVAEDNPVNQKVAARMLESLGYGVEVAHDGLEALEALSRDRYGAVLMDVQMPRLDGYGATGEIRRRESESGGPTTPIIAMTANALAGDREKRSTPAWTTTSRSPSRARTSPRSSSAGSRRLPRKRPGRKDRRGRRPRTALRANPSTAACSRTWRSWEGWSW